jgi:hypothetical protein
MPPESRRAAVVTAALILAATLAVYWPALGAGFVGDDFMILHRLRAVESFPDALRFFRGEFFEYYRPLAFVSHAIDWLIAGANPRQFHLTNLLLHAASTALVFLIARALAAGLPGAAAAALLFALHPSNHEAVVWMSARFDLLATCFALAAICWMVSDAPGARWGSAALFLGGLLSKESVVALPVAAAAWAVFFRRASSRQALVAVLPWLLALVAYALLRQAGGGIPAAGGASRLPKLLAFGCALAFVLACADERWLRLRAALRGRGVQAAALFALFVAAIVLASFAPGGGIGPFAREKLSVAGFALVYLLTPLTEVGGGGGYLQPVERIYAGAAMAGLPVLAIVLAAFWRPAMDDDRAWFVVALLVAALLPVSALTEGRRYLYLPSAVVAIGAGVALAAARGRWRRAVLAALAVLLAISTWRISVELNDWRWAGKMTAEGARLADDAIAPACNAGHIVFLTSPVGVRGVYTHFYYETFELPRGCMPATFQVVARLLRLDTTVSARWVGPGRIDISIPFDRGNLLISEDLRHFNLPLRDGRPRRVTTPLGELAADPMDSSLRLTLTLAPSVPPDTVFMFYSDGRMWPLPGAR